MNVSFILTMQSKIDTSMFKALRFYKLQFRVPFGYQANGGLFKALLCSQLLVQLLLELLWPLPSVPTWTPLYILHPLFSEDFRIQTTSLLFSCSTTARESRWQRNLAEKPVTTN